MGALHRAQWPLRDALLMEEETRARGDCGNTSAGHWERTGLWGTATTGLRNLLAAFHWRHRWRRSTWCGRSLARPLRRRRRRHALFLSLSLSAASTTAHPSGVASFICATLPRPFPSDPPNPSVMALKVPRIPSCPISVGTGLYAAAAAATTSSPSFFFFLLRFFFFLCTGAPASPERTLGAFFSSVYKVLPQTRRLAPLWAARNSHFGEGANKRGVGWGAAGSVYCVVGLNVLKAC